MELFLKLLSLKLTLIHFVKLDTKDMYINLPLGDHWDIAQKSQLHHVQLQSYHCHQLP